MSYRLRGLPDPLCDSIIGIATPNFSPPPQLPVSPGKVIPNVGKFGIFLEKGEPPQNRFNFLSISKIT
jgi:hypothetical protein